MGLKNANILSAINNECTTSGISKAKIKVFEIIFFTHQQAHAYDGITPFKKLQKNVNFSL